MENNENTNKNGNENKIIIYVAGENSTKLGP